MSILSALAMHNRWANTLIFDACAAIEPRKLTESSEGYDSVVAILNHLVQVEYVFLEFAHGRKPERDGSEDLQALREECAQLDDAYVTYATELNASDADSKRFLVPWFGFEVTLSEGIVQPLTHSHKHRADVSMLLPRLGGAGIEMDFIQWLDEDRDGSASR
jgi:uncharacterized damage-inducible protein DinB